MESIFNLDDDEIQLIKSKKTDKNKLVFAVLLKYFQLEGRYPKNKNVISHDLISSLASQLSINTICVEGFEWQGRSIERFRQEIRNHFGFREATLEDSELLKNHLIQNVLPDGLTIRQCSEYAYQYLRNEKIEPFTAKELERHIRSAYQKHEQQLFLSIHNQLSVDAKKSIDDLLTNDTDFDEDDANKDITEIMLRHLKKDIPGAKLKHVEFEIDKLNRLKEINLPISLFSSFSRKLIKKYYDRIIAEPPSDILRHPSEQKYALISLFCYCRSQLFTDSLADLFIQLIHKMETTAENYISKEILAEVKRVNGKFDILYQLANVSISYPEGIIREKIYPQVGQETLFDLIKDMNHKGKWYQSQVQTKIRSLYSHAHRKVLITLLEAFIFRANTPDEYLILEAIELIKKYRDDSVKYFTDTDMAPIKHVISSEWYASVIEENDKTIKINRINYEIAVLNTLRDKLRCKSIWIEGAYRYRNPDEDLPQDFAKNREHYFKLMNLPLSAEDFITSLKTKLDNSLKQLNNTISDNEKVKIINKDGGRIKLSPSEAQAEPTNLKKLHQRIQQRWSTINLIDILKEVDLRVGFTNHFHTVASRENIPKEVLQKRLLLGLYGIGSNAGLKRISAANEDITYSDLRYVKRRFINSVNVRAAIAEVINNIFDIKDPRFWGEATTSVACDSTKVTAWDQNLMTEWHTRYRGRGVMIYWHVDTKSTCIYSQLKTCSSSEVGSMIKGILQHCTKMDIDQAYVDTHGQSTVGFAVSYLLHFDLLPRLKNLNKQKLYYSSSKQKADYPNLDPILKDSINWNVIENNYDAVVSHMVALKTNIVEPDVLIKRFSNDNYEHPVYKALAEIGKAVKTIFLCRYLMDEALRIEIHEALNVVERLNSIMGFIFYGKLGEISTNHKDDQELSILCLHLLQVCMVYINTLIIQEILLEQEWGSILTAEDKRALSPLIHAHINPYGLFPLDLKKRIRIMVPDEGSSADVDEVAA